MTVQRHAVLVLGIARSGTSALAGALCAAGVNFGNDLKPVDWQNPQGNFEDFTLSLINQRILSAEARNWSSLRALPKGWRQHSAVRALEGELSEALEDKFGKSKMFGIKDPRLVPLFQLYDDVLSNLGIKVWTVSTNRPRREVLRSIRKSGYYHGHHQTLRAPLLYRKYQREIAEIANKRPVQTINFHDLVQTPEETMTNLCGALPFDKSGIDPDIALATQSIKPALYRNRN